MVAKRVWSPVQERGEVGKAQSKCRGGEEVQREAKANQDHGEPRVWYHKTDIHATPRAFCVLLPKRLRQDAVGRPAIYWLDHCQLRNLYDQRIDCVNRGRIAVALAHRIKVALHERRRRLNLCAQGEVVLDELRSSIPEASASG